MTGRNEGLLAAVEAGGTKVLCAVARPDGRVLDQTRIETTTPAATLAGASAFFLNASQRHSPLAALAIGSFGPLSLDPDAPDFGTITTTPKPGWPGTDLVRHFQRTLNVPVTLDTDVNAAAVGEMLFGSAQGLDCFCYVTVGTGIGVGIVIGGAPHGGANHPEAGHMRIPRAPGDADFRGICPYHGDCLEGLAAGPAMQARWGVGTADLPHDHPGWAIEADYLAALCANLTYVLQPQRIILGGGVMQAGQLHGLVRDALYEKFSGYGLNARTHALDDYIVAPGAGAAVGLTGALAMAYRAVTGRWPEATEWAATK
ncbi:ROK family protein [Sphingomonas sp. LaA6.9]|uniref:ROK family protein n=1 Tax=Sphingomonas sp. LaA6.9 TaxID=2919914 RepID=UPI001F4F7FAF|nr:ROK family protein [Sphingomonas sp. LaA6.9]MCJ8156885.1 ROK family protein [Sphingomonas sp. LaA6.9]